MVDGQRDFAAERQQKARDLNAENGIVTSEPDAEALAAMRQRLMQVQPALVEELGIDPAFIDRIAAVTGE